MKNYVQEGDVITVAAPYALTSGQGALVGSLFGIAAGDAASGADVQLKTEGIFDVAVLSTDVVTVGAKLYWDNTNKRLTLTSASNTLVGVATQAKATGVAVVRVYLDGAIR